MLKSRAVIGLVFFGTFLSLIFALSDRPQKTPHFVKVDANFFVSRYEVTANQFAYFLNKKSYDFRSTDQIYCTNGFYKVSRGMEFFPVYKTSVADAEAYSEWLSSKIGFEVRLPTEEEWLRAASGRLTNPSFSYGWGPERTAKQLLPVMKTIPNKEGFYGMSGNVAEWVVNKKGLALAMGGSWAEHSREKFKLNTAQTLPLTYAGKDLGFRVCYSKN